MKGRTRILAAALCLGLMLAAAARAEQAGAAEEISKQCAFRVSEGNRGKLTDRNLRTAWSYEQPGAYVGIRLPEGVEAGWLRVEWLFEPAGFELVEYDADLNPLRQRDQGDTFPNIYTVFELLPEARYLQLKMTAPDQEICSVRVYSRGGLPEGVQRWNPPVEKADVMLVSTHQDDEVVFMGGTIPYYATALKKPMIVVYMANCTRFRRGEALNCLWKMGVRDYPEFINLRDKRVGSIDEGIELWGGKDNVLDLLVARIRRFKPEVIVTHDLNGEYGHNQHKITARAMMYAVEAAADPGRFPDSFERYGAWQVKKLYHHLYGENQIMMDWETPLDALDGRSPLQVAQLGMEEQASQLQYYQVLSHGKYDNALFGLYFSTVGEDVAKDDFMEHIDPDASAKPLAAVPQPPAAEEPGSAAEAEAEADAEPAPQEETETAAETETEAETETAAAPEPESDAGQAPEPEAAPEPAARRGAGALPAALAIVGAAILVAGGWLVRRKLAGRRHRRRRR